MPKKQQHETARHIEELMEQDNKKTEFFLAASHQLKSPLAIIQWCLQSMTESPTVKKADRELVLKALAQANAMSHLVMDMLHVFRLANRRSKAQSYVKVNMNTLIDAVFAQYEPVAHKHKIHLEKGPIEVLPLVLADEVYLKQAVINLVDNAIKYSPSGNKVTLSAAETRGWVEISVQDHGIGMTEADKTKLFTEFFRSPNAQEFTSEGTGLGLVLVKHIVEEFGGEIKVKSQIGKGSTFTLRLPGQK